MSERIIALVAGESGTGKSFFVGQLRNALIYDTDIGGGLSYLDARIRANGSTRVEVGSWPEIFDDLHNRRKQLAEIHTLGIDHLTTLQQDAVARHNPTMADDFGRSSNKATKEWRRFRQLVRSGDYNLICTAHLKSRWEGGKADGLTADAAKNIDGDMSMVLHLRRGKPYPADAVVQKWRRDPDDSRGKVPTSFALTVTDFERVNGAPFSGDRVELTYATEANVSELRHLLEVVTISPEVQARWLAKAGAEDFAELTEDQIAKCISHVRSLIPVGGT